MRRCVALRYFNIGPASIYVVTLLAEPLLGGRPRPRCTVSHFPVLFV
jgi:hypothetical protein